MQIPMIRLPKWSLKYKFLVTLAAFTVVLSISFGLIAVQRLSSELEAQLISRGRYIANDMITKFWGPGSETFFATFLQAYNQRTLLDTAGGDILYVEVVKYNNIYAFKGTELIKDLGLDQQLLAAPIVPSLGRSTARTGMPYLDLIQPAVPWGELEVIDPSSGERRSSVNYVRLGLSLASIQDQVRKEFLVISGLTALYILVGLLVAFGLYKSILGPVESLTRSVKRFKRDRQARAHVTSGDELQTLAEEFNRMADSIQERDERLERVNRDLRKANQVKGEFLAMMGHELKTPIHAIRGYSQLLLEGIDGPLTPAQQEDLENIVKSGDHLRALIDNILQFSKLEAGGETLHLSEVEVTRLLEEALQNVKVLAREKGIELYAHGNGLRIQADETKLKQILINLVSNALKYTPQGQIEVTVEERNGEIVFAVRDTGIGIPQQFHQEIFEPFTQIDSSTTRQWGGIGLGLSIVKRYVEMHGGRIWLESAVGRGSTFYFTVPARSLSGDRG
jgi:signal transduction histidine kinase